MGLAVVAFALASCGSLFLDNGNSTCFGPERLQLKQSLQPEGLRSLTHDYTRSLQPANSLLKTLIKSKSYY